MRNAAPAIDANAAEHDFEVLEIAGGYLEQAVAGLPGAKLQDIMFDWSKGHIDYEPDDIQSSIIVSMAVDVALFQPSMSGVTALDRFIRSVRTRDPASLEALDALGKSQIRHVRIARRLDQDWIEVEDRLSGEKLVFIDATYSGEAIGKESLVRLCPLKSGRYILISPSFVLSPSAAVLIDTFVRPGKGMANPFRCAAAVYKHVVREGIVPMPRDATGFDGIGFDDEDIGAVVALTSLARQWEDAKADPADFEDVRSLIRDQADADGLLSILTVYDMLARGGNDDLSGTLREIAALLVDTLVRQARYGMVRAAGQIDFVRQQLAESVAQDALTASTATLFDTLLASARAGIGPEKAVDPALEKVIQKIRGLQAKTVDQGCTEEEAIAAARKAAELVDRYGLELSEKQITDIGCEALRFDTGRKKRNDTDLLINAVAKFFDCAGWLTKNDRQEIQYVIFGFRADAEAARFLIGRIHAIIDQATDDFKTSEIYRKLDGAKKRTASASFRTGMAYGIMAKLADLMEERISLAAKSSGKALVAVKSAMVKDEIARLGLSMRQLGESQARIHMPSFHAGKQSGLAFSPDDQIE